MNGTPFTPSAIRSTLTSAVALLAPVGVLALILSAPRLVQGSGITASLIPPGVGIVILLLVLAAMRAGASRRVALAATAFAVGYLIGFAVTEAAIQYIYARPFTPRADIPMIRSLIQLTMGPIGRGADFLVLLVTVVLAAALWVAGALWVWFVRWVARRAPAPTGGLAVITGVVLLTALVSALVPGDGPRSAPISRRAVTAWFDDGKLRPQEVVGVDRNPSADALAADTPSADAASADGPAAAGDASDSSPEPQYTFPGIRDRDIYFFAIEAYGYATVSQPEIFQALRADRERLQEVLAAKDYEVVTSYLRSPVAGGFSWLAEATFLTGQWITSQTAFEGLYDAELPSLTSFLYDGGYHTFSVRPGTVHGSWPEGWDLFRFEESLIAHDGDFDYAGPWFSYVAITDQYALWQAHRYLSGAISREGVAADRPIAAYYQLVSSHTPFNRIPPIIEEWEALGDGAVYEERWDEVLTFDNSWSGGTELIEGYSAAISYTLRSITKYIDEQLHHRRDPIIIIFGDHQAQRPIREPDAHLSVPIHVATRDPDVAERFRARGFQSGMVSDEDPPHRDMSDFFPLFTEIATDTAPAGQSSVR
ncbi:MAG: hypothetical protein ACOCU4_04580 [Alkalispirochaeta sp.]